MANTPGNFEDLEPRRASGEISDQELASAKERLKVDALLQSADEITSSIQNGHPGSAQRTQTSKPNDAPQKGKLPTGWLVAGGIIGAFMLIGLLNPRDPCTDKVGAFIMSQHFIRAKLKAPSTAEFPSMGAEGTEVSTQGTCSFLVRSYVDAQNGFGAQMRTSYIAVLSPDRSGDSSGENWTLNSLLLE